MLQKEFQKKNFKFYCEKCDYYSKRKSQFERHLQTNKHKNKLNQTTDYVNKQMYLTPT